MNSNNTQYIHVIATTTILKMIFQRAIYSRNKQLNSDLNLPKTEALRFYSLIPLLQPNKYSLYNKWRPIMLPLNLLEVLTQTLQDSQSQNLESQLHPRWLKLPLRNLTFKQCTNNLQQAISAGNNNKWSLSKKVY